MPTQPANRAQGQNPFFDPASLQGTLGPYLQLIAPALAQQQQAQDQLHQQAGQLQQQSQQAGQEYQQTAQQPLGAQSPGAGFYPGLFGDVASILTQNPEYQQRAQGQIKQQHEELVKSRLNNLTALKERYEQQADAARQMNNVDAETNMRAKADAVAKQTQVLLEGLRSQQEKDMLNQRQTGEEKLQGQRDTAAMERLRTEIGAGKFNAAAGGDGAGDWSSTIPVTQTDFGTFVNRTDVNAIPMKGGERASALGWAKNSGHAVLDQKAVDAMGDLQGSWNILNEQFAQARSRATPNAGLLPRLAQAGRAAAGRLTGDPLYSSFDTFGLNALRFARGTSVPTGGGMRWNEVEIRRAMQWERPNLDWDTQPILDQKHHNMEILVKHAADPHFSRDWRTKASENKKITVMDPTGKMTAVPFDRATDLITKHGYARVLSAPSVPKGEVGSSGEVPTGSQRTFGNVLKASRNREQGGGAKGQVMVALRKGDLGAVNKILDANPDLDEDPDINERLDTLLQQQQAQP